MRRDGFITHIFLAGVRGVVRGADRSIGRWAMPAGLVGVPNPYFSFPSFPVFGGGPNGWGKTWECLLKDTLTLDVYLIQHMDQLHCLSPDIWDHLLL